MLQQDSSCSKACNDVMGSRELKKDGYLLIGVLIQQGLHLSSLCLLLSVSVEEKAMSKDCRIMCGAGIQFMTRITTKMLCIKLPSWQNT